MSDVTSDICNDVLVASGAHAQAAQTSARRGHRAHRSCRRLTAVTCRSYVHGYASFRAGARSPLPPHHMRPSLSSIKYEYYYTRLAFHARAVTRGGLQGRPSTLSSGRGRVGEGVLVRRRSRPRAEPGRSPATRGTNQRKLRARRVRQRRGGWRRGPSPDPQNALKTLPQKDDDPTGVGSPRDRGRLSSPKSCHGSSCY